MFQSELLVIKNQDSHVLGGRRCPRERRAVEGRFCRAGAAQGRSPAQLFRTDSFHDFFFNSSVQFQYKL